MSQRASSLADVTNPGYLAYIDESGQRARTQRSSPHFVMSALVIRSDRQEEAAAFIADLRKILNRKPGDTLHWKNYSKHEQRRLASSRVGGADHLFRVCSVVVCKNHLEVDSGGWNQDIAYLYTLRFLLERLSWLARDIGPRPGLLRYTLAHVRHFKIAKLRKYEYKLMELGANISWAHLDPVGGQIDQPNRVEMLQLADLTASAIGAAFNPRQSDGTIQLDYVRNLAPVLYCPSWGQLASYGLKMHPWNQDTRAAYPWVAALDATRRSA